MYTDASLNGPLVTLDGKNGIINRIRAINRYIANDYYENPGGKMETFDLSECYSKLDQKELLRVVSDMIDMAFQGKNYLAVSVYEQTGR